MLTWPSRHDVRTSRSLQQGHLPRPAQHAPGLPELHSMERVGFRLGLHSLFRWALLIYFSCQLRFLRVHISIGPLCVIQRSPFCKSVQTIDPLMFFVPFMIRCCPFELVSSQKIETRQGETVLVRSGPGHHRCVFFSPSELRKLLPRSTAQVLSLFPAVVDAFSSTQNNSTFLFSSYYIQPDDLETQLSQFLGANVNVAGLPKLFVVACSSQCAVELLRQASFVRLSSRVCWGFIFAPRCRFPSKLKTQTFDSLVEKTIAELFVQSTFVSFQDVFRQVHQPCPKVWPAKQAKSWVIWNVRTD